MGMLMMEPTSLNLTDDDDRRIDELVLVRESDEHAKLMFDVCRQQTYASMVRSRSDVAAVAAMGLKPLEHAGPELLVRIDDGRGGVREELVALERIRQGSTSAVLFSVGGTYHLWSMASAAKINGEDYTNGFTQILSDVIRRLRPRVLRALNVSRLVRSTRQFDLLAIAIRDNVDFIDAEQRFDLRDDDSPGWGMLRQYAQTAATERRWIATRTQAGKVAMLVRGQWPMGKYTVPFGYVFDERTGRLTPDPGARETVRDMLRVLAGELPPAAMVQELSRLGVVTMRPNHRSRKREDIGTARNPAAILKSLYRYVPVWVHGEYLWRIKNLLAGLTEVMSVPIVFPTSGRPSLANPGELQMLFQVELPDGGWAEPELLAAVTKAAWRHRELSVARSRAKGSAVRAPFIGEHIRSQSADPELLVALTTVRSSDAEVVAMLDELDSVSPLRNDGRPVQGILGAREWGDGTFEYQLESRVSGEYGLSRVPKGTREGRLNRSVREWSDLQVIARFDKTQMHRAFVRALATAARSGLAAVHIRSYHVDNDAGVAVAVARRAEQQLRDRERHLERSAARAHAAYYDEDDPDFALPHLEEERRARAELKRVRQKLAELEQPSDDRPLSTFEAKTDQFAQALENIGVRSVFERAQVEAFRFAVPRFSVEATGDPHQWRCSATVRLPVEDGAVELGPVEWTMSTAGRSSGPLVAVIDSGYEAPGDVRSRAQFLSDMRAQQIDRQAALVLLNAPSAVRAIASAAPDDPPQWLPTEWRVPALVSHLHATYRAQPFAWYPRNTYSMTNPMRQAIVDVLANAGGTMSYARVRELLPQLGPGTPNGIFSASTKTMRRWEVPFTTTRREDSWYLSSIECESCGAPARFAVRAPEVPGDLLCSCGRIPQASRWGVDPDLRFPVAYQALAPSPSAVQQYLADASRWDERPVKPTPLGLQIVETLAEDIDYSASDVAQRLGKNPTGGDKAAMDRLVTLGLAVDVPGRPRRWRLVAGAKARVARRLDAVDVDG